MVGLVRLPVSAALGLARGRLSDDPGADLLPGRQPRRDDLLGHRTARSAARPDAGAQPDVVDELGRRLGHHPAIQPRPQPRRGRAGGSGGNQRGRQSVAHRPAGAADLRQGQPGRRADPDPGGDLEDDAFDPGRGPRRHPRRPENLAGGGGRPGQHQRRQHPGGAHPGEQPAARRLRAQHRRSAHHARPTPTSTRPRAISTGRAAPTRSTPTTRSRAPKTTTIWSSPTATARRSSSPMSARPPRPPKTPRSPPG